jgi:DNA polymerase-1
MLVSRSLFPAVLVALSKHTALALDTETTGLRPYKSDRLFSIAIATCEETPDVFYFNWNPLGADPESVLGPEHFQSLQGMLFGDVSKTWFAHNAKFDMAMLHASGLEIKGRVACTRAMGRIMYNEHMSYSLEESVKRLGLKKDDTVEKYIDAHGLKTRVAVPGRKASRTELHYDKVPLEIIQPYAEQDVRLVVALTDSLSIKGHELDLGRGPAPTLRNVVLNEEDLTKTLFQMERTGLLVDVYYTKQALAHEADRAVKATLEFHALTGKTFMASPKLFADVFADQKHQWEYTPKGNPSFESDVLKKFNSPVARAVLAYRDAKSKQDFYAGFLDHMDDRGYIHPNFNQDGTAHGRLSSSDPNFQNLTSEKAFECGACGAQHEHFTEVCLKCGGEVGEKDFLVRKAIIPPPGYVFIMPDYDQMEYRMMLDYAATHVGAKTPLVEKVLGGMDVHTAVAVQAHIDRDAAKTTNFLSIYGGGDKKLAESLGCSLEKAKAIRASIFQTAPEIDMVCRSMTKTAETRGWIYNWLGRRCHFPDPRFAYRAPNYVIAGGCADVNKIALNRISQALEGKKSKLVLTVHDENPCIVHESEIDTVPKIVKDIMESVYPAKYVPLTCGMEWSPTNLAAKHKGFPSASRNSVSA